MASQATPSARLPQAVSHLRGPAAPSNRRCSVVRVINNASGPPLPANAPREPRFVPRATAPTSPASVPTAPTAPEAREALTALIEQTPSLTTLEPLTGGGDGGEGAGGAGGSPRLPRTGENDDDAGDGSTSGVAPPEEGATGALSTAERARPASRRPLRRVLDASTMCGLGFLVSDLIAQVGVDRRHLKDVDTGRIARLLLFAMLFKGPLMSWFYPLLDKRLPGKTFGVVMQKMAIDQGPWTWMKNASFLLYVPLSEGMSVSQAVDVVKAQWVGMTLAGYKLWPLAHMLNYYAIPGSLRVAYVNVVEVAWTIYICFAAHNATKGVKAKQCASA